MNKSLEEERDKYREMTFNMEEQLTKAFEKDKYSYSIENCNVVITLKDNQIIKGKYDLAIGFMTSDGRMIWKENVLSYKFIKE